MNNKERQRGTVSSRRSCSAAGVLVLLVALSTATAPQTRSISGAVRTADDAPVARTEVSVDGGGANVTTDSGGFAFPLAPPLRVGFPATFRVAGWVVIDPCVLARGRTYLPDPDAETISIRVLRPRDRRLLSGSSMGCIVEERVSRFEPRSAPAGPHHSSLRGEGLPGSAARFGPGALGRSHPSVDSVRVTEAVYHASAHAADQRGGATRPCRTAVDPRQKELEQRVFAAINAQRAQSGLSVLVWNDAVAAEAREHSCRMAKLGFFSHDDPERGSSPERLGRAGIQSSGSAENIYRESGYSSWDQPLGSAKPERDPWLARQAKELGFKPKQLTSAIDRWARSVEDPYQKGLAALYQGRYAEATRYISASIASAAGNVVERYVPLARAEYELGNYTTAEAALRKVLAVHSNDPLVLDNLAMVSADFVSRVLQFWMQHPVHRSNILDRFFDQTGVGVFASGDGSYFVTQLFIAALPQGSPPQRPRPRHPAAINQDKAGVRNQESEAGITTLNGKSISRRGAESPRSQCKQENPFCTLASLREIVNSR